ncbi:MAG TPA: hypothetical protein VN723_03335 [Rhizomicrobium sp.]|jgi:hypothetical protein|nr:hypothetical protein [Rhizomicrobium sp.]
MVFLFDSLCAAILFVAAILSWWMAEKTAPTARIHLRFAALMLAALSIARVMPSADLTYAVALVAPNLAVGASFLALSFPRRASLWLSCLILIAALAAGLIAALQRAPVLAPAYQAGAALAMFGWALSRFDERPYPAMLAGLAATSLLFGAMTIMDRSLGQAMLFLAAFILLTTRASQTAIEEARAPGRLLIGGKRA